MTFRSDVQLEFREIFRNLYVTSSSLRVLRTTILQLIVGLIFLALLLAHVGVYALWLLYLISGLDPFQIITADDPLAIDRMLAGLFLQLFFFYVSGVNLGKVRRRLLSRLYVFAGRPLASVTGPPDFNFVEESCWSIKVEDRYFRLEDDCWLTDIELEKLQATRGEMRIWYVPSTGILVWAEWRPSI